MFGEIRLSLAIHQQESCEELDENEVTNTDYEGQNVILDSGILLEQDTSEDNNVIT